MTTERAQSLVITAFAASGALVLIKHASADELPPGRFVIGTGIAAVMLATLAQVLPDLAGALAVLILTTAALVYGGPAWKTISSAVS